MRLKVLAATAAPISLGLAVVAGMHLGEAELSKGNAISLNEQAADLSIEADSSLTTTVEQLITTACETTPESKSVLSRQAATAATVLNSPRQGKALAHPTNYGERVTRNIYGRSVSNQLIVVLHETVASAAATIQFFQRPHYKDSQQVSYHALVTRDGTIVYFVSSEKRAFGAGNSVFNGPNGPETVKTDPNLPPSVNNFAYHISLETPPDGNHNRRSHSGYTEAQYQSLAWLVAKTGVPDRRITTHQAVDRSGQRKDPRSFNRQKFLGILHTYPKQNAVAIQC